MQRFLLRAEDILNKKTKDKMNISLNKVDAVNGILEIKVVKDDYQPKVDAALKDYRKKAQIPGFRPGTAPLAMIKKMVGSNLKVDEINKLVGDAIYNYIQENKLNILGEPLPNTDKQKDIDFEKEEEFDFYFDLGFSPEIKLELSPNDHLNYYTIQVDEEMLDKQLDAYRNNYGSYQTLEEDAKITDMIKGDILSLDGTKVVENSVFMLSYMKDEEEQNKFVGAKAGDVIKFNPGKAYEGSESELSSLFNVKEGESVGTVEPEYNFEVKSISRFEKAEFNQDLFDKVFGKDTVTTEEEFKEKVKQTITTQLAPDSEYKFILDASEFLLAKVGEITFPVEFLKKWLLTSNKNSTKEQVDAEYSKIEDDLKFHLIKSKIAKDTDVKVENSDMKAVAIDAARAQFRQYGMTSLPDEMLENYADSMLKDKNMVNNIYEKAFEQKVIDQLKNMITIDQKTISMDDFKKFFEKEEIAENTEN